MARLNGKRRREMRLKQARLALAQELNPPLTTGEVRISLNPNRPMYGSSKSLDRGLLHTLADLPVYKQHKRSGLTGKGVVNVSLADPDKVTFPEHIRDEFPRLAKPLAVETKRVSRPNRVVPKSKKTWSERTKVDLPASPHNTFPGSMTDYGRGVQRGGGAIDVSQPSGRDSTFGDTYGLRCETLTG
ncbi:unnamed protein product [Sphagnum jensenii]